MTRQLGWGILGTGNIARQFATGVNASKRGRLVCVASRDGGKARSFADSYHAARSFESYDALLSDPDVTAVYVSLPNSMHHEWTIKALRAGKHVLCEKPFAVTVDEAKEMFAEAKKANRVMMEAFMYRCHPLTHAVMEQVKSGAIGKVRLIRTNFCFRTNRVSGNIRFDPSLAGGALMDVGCYCLSFSRLFAGSEPLEARAIARLHETEVDEQTAGFLRFPNDIHATFVCGMAVQADNTAMICGDEGYIEIPIPWKPPAVAAQYVVAYSTPPKMDQTAIKSGEPVRPPRQVFSVDAGGELYGVEADDFAASVLDGTPVRVSEAETMGNVALLQELRKQIGLKY